MENHHFFYGKIYTIFMAMFKSYVKLPEGTQYIAQTMYRNVCIYTYIYVCVCVCVWASKKWKIPELN